MTKPDYKAEALEALRAMRHLNLASTRMARALVTINHNGEMPEFVDTSDIIEKCIDSMRPPEIENGVLTLAFTTNMSPSGDITRVVCKREGIREEEKWQFGIAGLDIGGGETFLEIDPDEDTGVVGMLHDWAESYLKSSDCDFG